MQTIAEELSWRYICSQPEHFQEAFVKALQSEERSWQEWQPVIPLRNAEAESIETDPHLRSRIVNSHVVHREKNAGQDAKSRVVYSGFRDPEPSQVATVQSCCNAGCVHVGITVACVHCSTLGR
eukprot:4989392-Amphidinium_carterae.2